MTTTSTGGKYVPPFMKDGAKSGGVSMMSSRGRGEVRGVTKNRSPTDGLTHLLRPVRVLELICLVVSGDIGVRFVGDLGS